MAKRKPQTHTELDQQKKMLAVRLAPDVIDALQKQAGAIGISVPALIRMKLTSEIRG